MKHEKKLPDGQTVEEHLDDVTATPRGGGGGPTANSPAGHREGYMETWDVVEAPAPSRAEPLPDDDEDEW